MLQVKLASVQIWPCEQHFRVKRPIPTTALSLEILFAAMHFIGSHHDQMQQFLIEHSDGNLGSSGTKAASSFHALKLVPAAKEFLALESPLARTDRYLRLSYNDTCYAEIMLDIFQTGMTEKQKVVKRVNGNLSDSHCNWSETLPQVVPLEFYQQIPCSFLPLP